MCPHVSSNWQSASSEAVKILNKKCQEPKKLILKKHGILRLTQNTTKLSQGNVCILAEVPEADDVSILVFIAPQVDAVMDPKLYENTNFLSWDKVRIAKSAGFCFEMNKITVRRTQFPVTNYVALTVHKLMGDSFYKLATQVSACEKKIFSLDGVPTLSYCQPSKRTE